MARLSLPISLPVSMQVLLGNSDWVRDQRDPVFDRICQAPIVGDFTHWGDVAIVTFFQLHKSLRKVTVALNLDISGGQPSARESWRTGGTRWFFAIYASGTPPDGSSCSLFLKWPRVCSLRISMRPSLHVYIRLLVLIWESNTDLGWRLGFSFWSLCWYDRLCCSLFLCLWNPMTQWRRRWESWQPLLRSVAWTCEAPAVEPREPRQVRSIHRSFNKRCDLSWPK